MIKRRKDSLIIPCPRCEFIAKDGVAYWHCKGGYHPERLTRLDLILLAMILAFPLLIIIADRQARLS